MAEQTLKEFVVSLGWQGQDSDHEKFSKALEAATLRAELLAKGIEATVKALLGGANQTAAAYDKLYYAAERMHTTVAQIQALQYALGQVGGSSEEALATMETVAGLYQKDHGNLPYLQHIGFDIDKKTGQLKWTLETLKAHGLLEESDAQSSLWADNLHISQATMMRFKQHPYDIDKFTKEKIESDKRIGLDPDEGAKKADEFATAMGRFIMLLSGFYDKFTLKADESLTKPLEAFNDFLTENAPSITDILNAFSDAVGGVGNSISNLITTWLSDPKSKDDIKKFFEHLIEGVNWLISAIHTGGLIYEGLASPFNGKLIEKWKEGWDKTHFGAVEPGQPGDDGSFHITMNGREAAPEGSLKQWLTKTGRWIAEKIGGVVIEDGVIKSDNMKVGAGNPLPVKFDELDEDAESGGGGNYIKRAYNYMKSLLGGGGGGDPDRGTGARADNPHGMDPMAPAGTSPATSGLGEVHTSDGRTFKVAAWAVPNFQHFIDSYEAHGGRAGPNTGSLGSRPGNASYHPDGRAIDWNQTGRGRRGGGVTLPRELEDRLADEAGLWPGSRFHDAGHFEVRNKARALQKQKEWEAEKAKNKPPAPTSRLHTPVTSRAFAMRGHRALTARIPQPKIYNQEVVVHIDGSQDPATVGHIVGRHVTQLADEMTKRHKRTVG